MKLKSPIAPSKPQSDALVPATQGSSPRKEGLLFPCPSPWRPTLSGHNEAGHAVGHAGSGCQEGDAHDDVRNPQCVTNDRDLEGAGRGDELRADTRPTCPWSLCPRSKKAAVWVASQEATSGLYQDRVRSTSRAVSGRGCRSGPGCNDGARVLQAETGHFYLFLSGETGSLRQKKNRASWKRQHWDRIFKLRWSWETQMHGYYTMLGI